MSLKWTEAASRVLIQQESHLDTLRRDESFQPGTDRRPGTDLRGYRAGAKDCSTTACLRCRFTWRIRRANLHQRREKLGAAWGMMFRTRAPTRGDEAQNRSRSNRHRHSGRLRRSRSKEKTLVWASKEQAAAPAAPAPRHVS